MKVGTIIKSIINGNLYVILKVYKHKITIKFIDYYDKTDAKFTETRTSVEKGTIIYTSSMEEDL